MAQRHTDMHIDSHAEIPRGAHLGRRIGMRMGAVIVALALSAAGLAGCAEEKKTVKVPKPTITEVFPALSDEQLKAVLEKVAAAVDASDKALEAEGLDTRVQNPALDLRKAQYELAKKKDGGTVTPMPFSGGTLTLTASQTWPRYVVNIAAKDKDSATFVHLLTQNDARSQFKLSEWVRLFPQQTVPPTAVTQKGAPIIANDATQLKKTPADVAALYGESLLDEAKMTENGFDDDLLAQTLRKEDKDYKDALEEAYEFSHSVKPDGDVIAIGLEDGGALVFANYIEKVTIQRKNENATMKMSGDIALLMGDEGKADKGLEATNRMMTLTVIPAAKAEGNVHVIGAERILTSAKAL
ncbi:MAG: hypothetical protein Q4P66_09765 [Actinomycetaceae bacterium]|nr:hypothetical protein [Actinomycetaceae bacterium]